MDDDLYRTRILYAPRVLIFGNRIDTSKKYGKHFI